MQSIQNICPTALLSCGCMGQREQGRWTNWKDFLFSGALGCWTLHETLNIFRFVDFPAPEVTWKPEGFLCLTQIAHLSGVEVSARCKAQLKRKGQQNQAQESPASLVSTGTHQHQLGAQIPQKPQINTCWGKVSKCFFLAFEEITFEEINSEGWREHAQDQHGQ